MAFAHPEQVGLCEARNKSDGSPSVRGFDLTCGERRQCAVCEWLVEAFCSATTHFGASRVVLAQSHYTSPAPLLRAITAGPHSACKPPPRRVCTCSLEPYITGSPPVSPILP